MTPSEQSNTYQRALDRLPTLVGLCPTHAQEFYLPLEPGERTGCPEPGCSLELVVYERSGRFGAECRS